MTTSIERAQTFASLHIKRQPVILFNIWDAGSAKAVQEAGAKAVATGSASVAAAQGHDDGEDLPLEVALDNARRIVRAVEVPVTLDFEGGYAREPERLQQHIARVLETGIIGINFEDQVVQGEGLYSLAEQSRRVRAIREAADQAGIPLFINARTDIFLQAAPATHQPGMVTDALERAAAYAQAGASGFFVPGLRDEGLIEQVCARSPLPVNIFRLPGMPPADRLAALGAARISYGPFPYRNMIEWLKTAAREALA
jgi:2-methylisocitrate lyase-like PEP mutase family enzyme